MMYKVKHGEDVFELNPELRAIEEFSRLTSRQMTYVILTTDYLNPFRKLTAEDRKYHAALQAGYKLEKDGKRLDMNARNVIAGKDGKIEAAISYYSKIQRDEDRETYISICFLISQVRDANNIPNKTLTDLKTIVDMNIGKLDKLMETKKKLEEILDFREDTLVTETGAEADDSVDESSLSLLAEYNQTTV